MNKFVGLILLAMVLVLSACGGDAKETSKKDVSSVTGEEKGVEKENQVVEDKGEKKELNLEIADTENIKATLISIEKIVDKEWDEEKYQVKFEIENNRTDNIGVQAREVSADGKMIDESMLTMSTDISAGKRADAVLEIQNYDGDLPEINENFEMVLYIYSEESYDMIEEHEVIIEMK